MTPNEARDAIKRLRLTQKEAAALLGVSLRSVVGYANGDRRIPQPVARLLRLHLEAPRASDPSGSDLSVLT